MHLTATFSSKETTSSLVRNDSFPGKKKFFPIRKIFFFLPGILLLFLTAHTLKRAWQINAWSLAFARPALINGLAQMQINEPPEGHLRGEVWMANVALYQNRISDVWRYLENSSSVLVSVVEGNALVVQDNFDEAVKIWLTTNNYAALMNISKKAHDEHQVDKAIQAALAARQLKPAEGTLPLVNLYQENGNLDEAIAILQDAVLHYPESGLRFNWLNRLGNLLRLAGHLDEAETVYLQLENEKSDSIWVYIGLGWVYYERDGDVQKAAAMFQRAVYVKPDLGHGYFAMGQLLMQEKRYDEANTWFAQAIQRDPEIKWWHLARANAARAAGDLEQALKLYEDTIAHFPDWAPAYYEMAWNYRLMERPAEAIQTIDRALSLSEGSPAAWYYVYAGQIYEWAGEQDAALGFYNKALQLAPENAIALQGVERLSK